MAKFRQDPPFAVQVELSEGCNLFCNFCGLQGIREKPGNFKFMTKDVAKGVASQLKYMVRDHKWNPRIEFAMHGEPTMNPDYIDIIRFFRRKLPRTQLMMTSNGGGLLRPPGPVESLNQLFEAGLNIFAFDAYEYVKIKDKVDSALDIDAGTQFEVHRYPDEPEWSPHTRYGHKAKLFIRVQDISVAVKGTHSSLNNHCGCGSKPLRHSLEARCAKPFRELSIRWDGSVAICCNDWRGVYKCGNIITDGIERVWYGAAMNAARRYLMQGDRESLNPCDVCDAKSYRVGLLPDKKGKITLREPDERDAEIVKKATAGKTLAPVVIRPWEIRKRKPA